MITIRQLWPDRYQATQRAVLTIRRKQFVLDAFLASDPEEGLHLAIVSTLGVVTEVQRQTNGVCNILKTTALLPEPWARQYVAQDLAFVFAPPGDLEAIGTLDDQRIVLAAREGTRQRRFLCTPDGSRLDALEVLENDRRIYTARFSPPQPCAGSTAPVPLRIEVDAGLYQLDIRTVQMRTPPRSAALPAATVAAVDRSQWAGCKPSLQPTTAPSIFPKPQDATKPH